MDINEALKSVGVIGAAGKMGRGIALLLLQEMARLEADKHGQVDGTNRRLLLIDRDEEALQDLRHYLNQQMLRYAEKNINNLRRYYATNTNLISNEQIITAFVDGALDIALFETEISALHDATLIFEAVVENIEAKSKLLKEAKGSKKQFFFTNTSSIPIAVLRKKSELGGFLLGFHFYNPPPVQKLIELITPTGTDPEAKQIALDLAKALNKIVVESADVAGFIGNGHFIREILFACAQVRELSKQIPQQQAVWLINTITGDYLLRPMGIFQLVDFVGIDVVSSILKTMKTYQSDEVFEDPIIDTMISQGVLGGISSNGTLKDGFFQYVNNKIVGIYNSNERKYYELEPWIQKTKTMLGPLPSEYQPRKTLIRNPDAQKQIELYFDKLFESGTPGSEITLDFLLRSREIARRLVRDGIAHSMNEVNAVLTNGFYHLYQVDIPWINLEKVIKGNLCDI